MKESYSEGVANHAGLRSYAGVRKGAGGTLIEVRAGRVLSREISIGNWGADVVSTRGRRNRLQRLPMLQKNPTRSKTPQHARKHSGRELGDPIVVRESGPHWEV
jgi:hypothetical protein